MSFFEIVDTDYYFMKIVEKLFVCYFQSFLCIHQSSLCNVENGQIVHVIENLFPFHSVTFLGRMKLCYTQQP